MKRDFHQKFINNHLDQTITVDFNGYSYDIRRIDGTGYSTKLTLNENECERFVETMLNHGWEKVNGRRTVQSANYGES